MYFYLAAADDLDERELSSFNPRELEVLNCAYRFSINVWYRTRGVETFSDLRRAIQRVVMIQKSGGRAALYAVRRCSLGEDWYAHITLKTASKLCTADRPELPPMTINGNWTFTPQKAALSAERKKLATIRQDLNGSPQARQDSTHGIRRRL